MTKSGKVAMFSFALVAVAVTATIFLSNQQKEIKFTNTYDQFRNRIKEFYSGINLQEAEIAYDTLVNGGMNPFDAYKIVGCI